LPVPEIDDQPDNEDNLHDPHWDPVYIGIFNGEVSASIRIFQLQPVCSWGRVIKQEIVSAITSQINRKTSRLCSTAFTLNGRMSTAKKSESVRH